MTSLREFFNLITGIDIDITNPVQGGLLLIFGFIIVYDILHILFSSIFAFQAFK